MNDDDQKDRINEPAAAGYSASLDLNLPSPGAPLAPSHRIGTILWADYMDEIAPILQRFLKEHDRPEERLARKIPERFVLEE